MSLVFRLFYIAFVDTICKGNEETSPETHETGSKR